MTPAQPESQPPEATPRTVIKLITLLAILVVWGVITVGIAFDVAEVTQMYQYLTGFLVILASRYWGVPSRLLAG